MVEVGAAPAPSRLDSPRDQVEHPVEVLPGEVGVRCRRPDHVEEGIDPRLGGGGDLGHQLLGEHIEGSDRRLQHVEPPGPDPRQQGGALDKLVAGERVEPPGRGALELVVGPPHPLEEGADGPGGPDLAHQLDRSHVDAQLERGGGHQRPQVAGPQALLDDAATGGRQAAVVGRHLEGGVDPVDAGHSGVAGVPGGAGGVGRAESQGELVGDPLGHLAGVDEHQRGAVLEDVGGDPVEDVGELEATGHRFELAPREFDGHVEVPPVPAVDDGGRRPRRVRSRQESGHHLEGALRGREPDALETGPLRRHQGREPLETEGQVRTPLVPGQRVHLVDDHRVRTLQHGPRRWGRQQEVERLGGGHQQVGGRSAHGRPLGLGSVAGAHRDRQRRRRKSEPGRFLADAGQWHRQVLVDVDGQGPERGDVDDAGAGRPGTGQGPGGVGPVGGVDGHQKSGQCLAGAGRRSHEHVSAADDVGPGPSLWLGRSRGEPAEEPAGHGGVEGRQDRIGLQRVEAGRRRCHLR